MEQESDSRLEFSLILDELNKFEITQLHNATLNFSKQSLQTKKLCATIGIASLTLILGLYHEITGFDNFFYFLISLSIIIPSMFYSVDVMLYFYQDRLRGNMIIEENKIRQRHNLELREIKKHNSRYRLLRSLFNESQLIYVGLSGIMFLLSIISC